MRRLRSFFEKISNIQNATFTNVLTGAFAGVSLAAGIKGLSESAEIIRDEEAQRELQKIAELTRDRDDKAWQKQIGETTPNTPASR